MLSNIVIYCNKFLEGLATVANVIVTIAIQEVQH